jgi:hypothetical protein
MNHTSINHTTMDEFQTETTVEEGEGMNKTNSKPYLAQNQLQQKKWSISLQFLGTDTGERVYTHLHL